MSRHNSPAPTLAADDRLAQIDKRERIPRVAADESIFSDARIRVSAASLGRTLADRVEHRMPADAAEPILRVREIALAAMHDRVPEAARRRVDPLADGVRLVQIIVQQPHARHAARGHVVVGDLRVSKRSFG